jgi:HD-GYP domain-containing protein (c-di-GMP phosphodiesterase class II)
VLDEALGKPVAVATYGKDNQGISENTISNVEDILQRKMAEALPLLIKDIDIYCQNDTSIRSIISVPLNIQDKAFGILTAVMTGEDSRRFQEKDLYYLDFLGRRTAVVVENVALYENIYENLFCTLYAFVEAIEVRDPYTKQHSSRVAIIARIIGQEMGCSDEELDLLHFSGHLHDVGKIGIRDSILLKPGRLTEEEYEIIKQHPVIGENIVSHLGLMSREQKVIRHHHERWDGSGYPDRLRGEAIPFLSRILAVSDVYDAMASDRAYRTRRPTEKIIRTIVENAGTQFDAEVVKGFLRAYDKHAFAKVSESAQAYASHHNRQLDSKMVDGFRFNMTEPCPERSYKPATSARQQKR